MSDLDDLIKRTENSANISSLCGVSCLLRPSDVFCLLEWTKALQAERNVLKETLERIAHDSGNSVGAIVAEETLRKLYAP